MSMTLKLEGIDKVTAGINAALRKINGASAAGLAAAGWEVIGKATPNTPVDTGNLRNSAGVNVFKPPGAAPFAVIYYTAFYAVFVHEIQKNYKVGGWKFLETALKQNQKQIVEIVAGYIRRGIG